MQNRHTYLHINSCHYTSTINESVNGHIRTGWSTAWPLFQLQWRDQNSCHDVLENADAANLLNKAALLSHVLSEHIEASHPLNMHFFHALLLLRYTNQLMFALYELV